MVALTDQEVQQMLETGIQQLGLALTQDRMAALLDYLELLQKWNRSFNLSGVKDPRQMVSLHLLDSLAISPYLDGQTILDVGSGAGLPGIPLAIFNPDKNFVLLDSNGKKTRFLFQVKLALKLDNVTIENKRVEHYDCPRQIDIVISRAFSSLSKLVELCSLATGNRGQLMAMKGAYPQQEIAELPDSVEVGEAVQLHVPGIEASRYLIRVSLGSGQQK
ncbi:MAG: 16S rRNA (guanine(527)-N(7))-methyltransferase RsmG [Gammaproteobacteria bacterium]|nr:16S rRNA (guanine(527)-N(7))-methyltransferase RsmG [Gammaproteobacteria bacterium]